MCVCRKIGGNFKESQCEKTKINRRQTWRGKMMMKRVKNKFLIQNILFVISKLYSILLHDSLACCLFSCCLFSCLMSVVCAFFECFICFYIFFSPFSLFCKWHYITIFIAFKYKWLLINIKVERFLTKILSIACVQYGLFTSSQLLITSD